MTHRNLFGIPLQLLLLFAPLLEAAVTDPQFIVVIDAGSTGTQLNVFEFGLNCSHPTRLRIINHKVKKMSKGLSAFAKNPDPLNNELTTLMDFATASVPKELHASTPAIVRATRGLQLEDELQAVFCVLVNVLRNYTFNVPIEANEIISVLSVLEEAKFSWVAVNFLKGAFDQPGRDTYGMLDLDDELTHMAYVPNADDIRDPKRIVFETASGQRYSLYARSYPYLGRSQAFMDIFGYRKLRKSNPEYVSDCLNGNFSGNYSFGSVSFNVAGNRKVLNKTRANHCLADVSMAILSKNLHKIFPNCTGFNIPVNVKSFVALNAFFDTARDLTKLTFLPGNSTNLGDCWWATEQACLNTVTNEPYLCLDSMYNYFLIDEVYNLWPSQDIIFTDRISGYSAGWPLGFAISHLSEDVKRKCW